MSRQSKQFQKAKIAKQFANGKGPEFTEPKHGKVRSRRAWTKTKRGNGGKGSFEDF